MSSPANSFGVPTVQFGLTDLTTTLPSLSAATVTAANTAWTRRRKNSSFKNLSGTYKIGVILMGYDDVNGGYALGEMSPLSADVTVASGEGILIRIDTPPAGMSSAVAAGIVLQKGSATPQIAGYAYVDDTGNPFAHMHRQEPSNSSPRVAASVLTDDSQVTDLLKYRTPVGAAWTNKAPTTGGVKFLRKKITADYLPDTGDDAKIPLGGSTALRFSIYSSSLDDLADNVGGDFVIFPDTNGDTVELVSSDPYIIQSTLDGNRAIKVNMPADNTGKAVTRLLLGNSTVNIADSEEDWNKKELYKLDIETSPISFDPLLFTFDTTLYYARY